MALAIKDRVRMTTTTTGTGTLTLGSAVTGYQAFSAIGDGNTCYFCIEAVDSNGIPTGDWEVSYGTYTASGTTLSRTTTYASSNSGSAVSLSSGTKHVFVVVPATVFSSLPRVYSGSLTRDMATATGTQSITGLGFKPRVLLGISCGTVGGSTQASIDGADDGTTKGCMEIGGAAGNCFPQTTFAMIWRPSSASGNYQVASISSFDNDGFTLSWTKTGTPTGTATVTYFAFG